MRPVWRAPCHDRALALLGMALAACEPTPGATLEQVDGPKPMPDRVQIEVSPTELDFDAVEIGSNRRIEIAVRNTGDVRAQVRFIPRASNISVCGDEQTAFCMQQAFPGFAQDPQFGLEPKEQQVLFVSFRPTSEGEESTRFLLEACDDPSCRFEFVARGRGLRAGFVCPESFDFGSIPAGECRERKITCSTFGFTPTQVRGAEIESSQSSFAFATGVPSTILGPAPDGGRGDELTMRVLFCPDGLAEYMTTLTVFTANEGPLFADQRIELRGSGGGPGLCVEPTVLRFEGQTALLAATERSITVSNCGVADLMLNQILVDTAATGAFRLANPADATPQHLRPGESIQLDVVFSPTREGPVESTMLLRPNDPAIAETEVPLTGVGVNLPPCSFELSESSLDFGNVAVPTSAIRVFEVRNRSDSAPCAISGLSLDAASDPQFALVSGQSTFTLLDPGAAWTVAVRMDAATTGTANGRLRFWVSSPEMPEVTVDLRGSADGDPLLLSPQDLDFGVLEPGCESRIRPVSFTNRSDEPVTIERIELRADDSVFSVQGRTGPFQVPAKNQITPFSVTFRGGEPSEYGAQVEVHVRTRSGSLVKRVSLQARVEEQGELTQIFEPPTKVDLLFVVDDSDSMQAEHEELERLASSMFGSDMDLRVAVTSSGLDDLGLLRPLGDPATRRIVDSDSSPSPEEAFRANVDDIDRQGGESRLFEAALEAVTGPNALGPNAGFVRPDAILSIIALTDSADRSPESVEYYRSALSALKSVRMGPPVTFSGVSGGESGCTGDNEAEMDVGSRIRTLTNRLWGQQGSVCSPGLRQVLRSVLSEAIAPRRVLPLTVRPLVQSLEVRITRNGTTFDIPERDPDSGRTSWQWDPSSNALVFEPGFRSSDTYSVSYRAVCR